MIDKFVKYEYLAGEEILPINQSIIIEQPKFSYSPIGRQQKQLKTKEQNKFKLSKFKARGNQQDLKNFSKKEENY